MRGKGEEDLVAECEDRAARQRDVPKWTVVREVMENARIGCVHLFIKTGELMKIILSWTRD